MGYAPSEIPADIDPRLAQWLLNEVLKIKAALQSPESEAVLLSPLHVEPSRLQVGMVVYADGTDWNPGGGAGAYEYTGAGTNGWRKLSSGIQY